MEKNSLIAVIFFSIEFFFKFVWVDNVLPSPPFGFFLLSSKNLTIMNLHEMTEMKFQTNCRMRVYAKCLFNHEKFIRIDEWTTHHIQHLLVRNLMLALNHNFVRRNTSGATSRGAKKTKRSPKLSSGAMVVKEQILRSQHWGRSMRA